MSKSTTPTDTTATNDDHNGDFIIKSEIIKEIAYGINQLGTYDETVLRFTDDGVITEIADGAEAMLLSQFVPSDAFEHYNLPEINFGVDTNTLEDLAGMVSPSTPIHFKLQETRGCFEITAEDVEFTLGGIAVDTVNGQLDGTPTLDPEVTATVPTDKFSRASTLAEMSTGSDHLIIKAGDGEFKIEGDGDTDRTSLDVKKNTDTFEFTNDPGEVSEAKYSSDFVERIAKVIDEDTVDFGFASDHLFEIQTTREDVIDTEIFLAPRLDTSG